MSWVYIGKCIGGPHDGQMMEHWEKEKAYYRPMIPFQGVGIIADNTPIEAVEIGRYVLGNFGHWHWLGSPS